MPYLLQDRFANLFKHLFFRTRGSGQVYEPVHVGEEKEDTSEAETHLPFSRPQTCPWIWIISTFTFAILFALTLLWNLRKPSFGTYETGFSTDFAPSRSAIELRQVRFTSGVQFDDEGKASHVSHPGLPVYVGPPSPEIDEEWHKLTSPEYFFATEPELIEHWGGEEGDYTDRYFQSIKPGVFDVQLDIFHNLHCLNMIRRGLDKQYYYPEHVDANRDNHPQVHWDHCIDQIRQVLMCHGDMTMNGVLFYPSVGTGFVDTESLHTCRNFDKLREWATRRSRSRMTE